MTVVAHYSRISTEPGSGKGTSSSRGTSSRTEPLFAWRSTTDNHRGPAASARRSPAETHADFAYGQGVNPLTPKLLNAFAGPVRATSRPGTGSAWSAASYYAPGRSRPGNAAAALPVQPVTTGGLPTPSSMGMHMDQNPDGRGSTTNQTHRHHSKGSPALRASFKPRRFPEQSTEGRQKADPRMNFETRPRGQARNFQKMATVLARKYPHGHTEVKPQPTLTTQHAPPSGVSKRHGRISKPWKSAPSPTTWGIPCAWVQDLGFQANT